MLRLVRAALVQPVVTTRQELPRPRYHAVDAAAQCAARSPSHVIHVEHATIDGITKITVVERGVACLVAHDWRSVGQSGGPRVDHA
jgi:hypothetical protein